MQLQSAKFQAPDEVTSPRFFAPALMISMALLALIWASTWWFDIDRTVAMAISMVIVVVGLIAHGIGMALDTRRREQVGMAFADRIGPPRGEPGIAAQRPRHGMATAQAHLQRWTPDVFEAIDAQRFAAVCETWFAWAGFDTRSERHRTDEGVDIWLHAAKVPGPVAIVRCKHRPHKPVGLQDMKEFLGVVAGFESVHGTYTTTSTYTPEALQFARENGIDAVDGRGLLRRIQTRTRQRQQALLAVAFGGS